MKPRQVRKEVDSPERSGEQRSRTPRPEWETLHTAQGAAPEAPPLLLCGPLGVWREFTGSPSELSVKSSCATGPAFADFSSCPDSSLPRKLLRCLPGNLCVDEGIQTGGKQGLQHGTAVSSAGCRAHWVSQLSPTFPKEDEEKEDKGGGGGGKRGGGGG